MKEALQAESVKDKIARLRDEAYLSAVAQTAHGSVLLQMGAFATEADFDRDLNDLVTRRDSGVCWEF